MQHGAVEIVEVIDVLGRLDAQLVGVAHHRSALDAAAGHPGHHGLLVVVAAGMGPEEVHGVIGGASEFPGPDHQGLIQQSPLLQVLQQRRDRLVGLVAPLAVLLGDIFVGVPAAAIDLDVADTPLHQAAGHQAPSSHGLLDLVVEAVHFLDLVGLAVDVHRLGHGELHAEGQLVILHAGQQVLVAGVGLQVGSVQPIEQRDVGLLLLPGDSLRRLEIEDRRPHRVQQGAVGGGRQISVGVVDRPAGDSSPLVGQDHEGRQVLALAAEPVNDPGTDRGTAGNGDARVHHEAGPGMGLRVGVERSDHGDVVHAGGQVGEDLRNFHAALPVPCELEGAAHVNPLFQAAVDAGDRGPVILGQRRFGVEGVHLAGSPLHEEKDAGLGLGGEVGLLGSQRVRSSIGRLKPAVPAEQRRERQASHASAESVQEVPAPHLSQARVRSFHP